MDSLPPGLLAVGTYPRQRSQTAAVPLRRTPTAMGRGGRLSNPTAVGPDGNKRVKSRNFFKQGSDPEILSKKGQNTKFGRAMPLSREKGVSRPRSEDKDAQKGKREVARSLVGP